MINFDNDDFSLFCTASKSLPANKFLLLFLFGTLNMQEFFLLVSKGATISL